MSQRYFLILSWHPSPAVHPIRPLHPYTSNSTPMQLPYFWTVVIECLVFSPFQYHLKFTLPPQAWRLYPRKYWHTSPGINSSFHLPPNCTCNKSAWSLPQRMARVPSKRFGSLQPTNECYSKVVSENITIPYNRLHITNNTHIAPTAVSTQCALNISQVQCQQYKHEVTLWYKPFMITYLIYYSIKA